MSYKKINTQCYKPEKQYMIKMRKKQNKSQKNPNIDSGAKEFNEQNEECKRKHQQQNRIAEHIIQAIDRT